MQEVILIILLIIFGLYMLLIGYYRSSWLNIQDHKQSAGPCGQTTNNPQDPVGKPQTRITVIIPARNEQENIAACLDSICNQTYPKELFEVLVVDDHSTDSTAAIVSSYATKNVTLISLTDFVAAGEINSYKKKAIEVAIARSTGELMVTTDADCLVKENWLQTIAAFYERYDPAFIAAPVGISLTANSGKNSPQGEFLQGRFLQIFQALDFMSLQGITGASVFKKIHSMCNGANLAYTKKAFNEVGGFTGIDHIASGDDMLLMHKIYKRYPGKVLFLKSKAAIVQTAPVHTVKEFFNQRIRWASKADKYEDKRIFAVLLLVYVVNVLLLVLPVFALFNNVQWSLVIGHWSLMGLWLFLLFTKTIAELIFLYPVATFFGKRKLLWLFPLMQPFHIIYTVIAGWLGKFGSYHWKERKVK
jgi:cellulose synthase/poly-beta-1,6-N-acetylglucosamine synthase-like glycosyltransferase